MCQLGINKRNDDDNDDDDDDTVVHTAVGRGQRTDTRSRIVLQRQLVRRRISAHSVRAMRPDNNKAVVDISTVLPTGESL